MNSESVESVLARFDAATTLWSDACSRAPQEWHLPPTDQIEALIPLLFFHAEMGEMYCQYALGIIYWFGLICRSQKEYLDGYPEAVLKATHWLNAAANQGHRAALDNLITDGTGPEAERLKKTIAKIEKDYPKWEKYGPEFIGELIVRYYGSEQTLF